MQTKLRTAVWTAVALLSVASTAVIAKTTTVTGKIGDAMCGTKHMMAGDEAGCTRACVKKGSDYALIVKDKVYTLKTSSDAIKDQLDKLAGQTAKVTGDLNGETIAVTSVTAAK
jgi:hypothetical protein